MPFIDHFDVIAPFYDRVIQPGEPERLVALVDLPVNGALLDAGGGTGRISKVINGLASPIVIADLSLGMLRQTDTKNGLSAVCSHTEGLPFPDGSFERVIIVDALHHVCDHQETARELWRVLKPGGRIVIGEPDIRNFTVKLVALAEKLALMRSHFIAPPRIEALFDYPNARTETQRDGLNAWIIVDKSNQGSRD